MLAGSPGSSFGFVILIPLYTTGLVLSPVILIPLYTTGLVLSPLITATREVSPAIISTSLWLHCKLASPLGFLLEFISKSSIYSSVC